MQRACGVGGDDAGIAAATAAIKRVIAEDTHHLVRPPVWKISPQRPFLAMK